MSHPLRGPSQRVACKAVAWAIDRAVRGRDITPEAGQRVAVAAHWTWHYTPRYGLAPEPVFCLQMLETGFMTSQLVRTQRNPGGLKTTDGSGFARFTSLHRGVLAVVQHVAAYAGVPPPFPDEVVDPRWQYVKPGSRYWASARTTADLAVYGGAADYPAKVDRLIEELLSST